MYNRGIANILMIILGFLLVAILIGYFNDSSNNTSEPTYARTAY